MKNEYNRLIAQGYRSGDLSNNPHVFRLTRWTPLACVAFSTVGLILELWEYFFVVALLNLSGAFSSHSFYDRLYTFFAPFLKWGKIPAHGLHRKIGCGLGGIVFMNAAIALFFDMIYLAYIPLLVLTTMAFVAGIFNWCFVSSVVRLFVRKEETYCC